ncbi:MAG TPA: ABC transporter ATP-binding protein [Polyangiaceae bacterium]|nr:ABC transporter ATP-binding protein [Polyangiaceae bacterium]
MPPPPILDEAPSGKGLDWPLLRRFWQRTQPHARQRRIVLVTTAIRAVQRPLLFWATAAVINGPIAAHDATGAWLGSLGFLGLALTTAFVFHLRQRHMNEFGEQLVHDLRRDLFANLQRQPSSYFHKTKLGRILSRVVSDIEATRRGVQLCVFLGQEFLQLAVCGGLMLYQNRVLFLVILAFTPFVLWSNRYFHPRLHRFSRVAAESQSRLTGVLAEAVRGVRVIQGFARQGRGEQAFARQADQLAYDNVTLASTSALYAPLLGLTGQLFLAALLVIGGYGALHDFAGLEIESLVAFFFLPTSFFMSVQAAASYYPQILSAQVGAERVFQLVDLTPEWEDAPDAHDLPDPRTPLSSATVRDTTGEAPAAAAECAGVRVEFRGLTFGYEPTRPVLHDVDLVITPGQTVALVGHTGSGKSTMAGVVAKFYLPSAGAVLIDGHDTRALRSQSLRRQLGLVQQSNFLFGGTVRDNLRFARPDASDADLEDAARRLDCLDLLLALPRGLDTEVGEGGASLSLGQRQLVCFTRALLADPRLLILDEATSAIDPVTEHRIQRALTRLLTGRTSLVIAHRLSTIVQADVIVVLDHGRILERGSHHALLAQRGAYHALYREFVASGLAGDRPAHSAERPAGRARSEQLQPA